MEKETHSNVDHAALIEQYKKKHEQNGFKLIDKDGRPISPLSIDKARKKNTTWPTLLLKGVLILILLWIIRMALLYTAVI